MNIGGVIAALRTSRGWSQSELAAKIGRSQVMVSYWESGKSRPTPKHMDILSKAFNMPTPIMYALSLDESDFTKTKIPKEMARFKVACVRLIKAYEQSSYNQKFKV